MRAIDKISIDYLEHLYFTYDEEHAQYFSTHDPRYWVAFAPHFRDPYLVTVTVGMLEAYKANAHVLPRTAHLAIKDKLRNSDYPIDAIERIRKLNLLIGD